MYDSIRTNECLQLLTDGQPLHSDETVSATTPTATSLASIDLTTPATSFPAASRGPASVPNNVRVCLDIAEIQLKLAHLRPFTGTLILCFSFYLETTLAAADLRALTAREWVSSATAERMKPSSSVNTVTELDFLLTPRT